MVTRLYGRSRYSNRTQSPLSQRIRSFPVKPTPGSWSRPHLPQSTPHHLQHSLIKPAMITFMVLHPRLRQHPLRLPHPLNRPLRLLTPSQIKRTYPPRPAATPPQRDIADANSALCRQKILRKGDLGRVRSCAYPPGNTHATPHSLRQVGSENKQVIRQVEGTHKRCPYLLGLPVT